MIVTHKHSSDQQNVRRTSATDTNQCVTNAPVMLRQMHQLLRSLSYISTAENLYGYQQALVYDDTILVQYINLSNIHKNYFLVITKCFCPHFSRAELKDLRLLLCTQKAYFSQILFINLSKSVLVSTSPLPR